MDIELRAIKLTKYETRDTEWSAWFALELFDNAKGITIPESFSFFAASDEKAVDELIDFDPKSSEKSLVMPDGLDILRVTNKIQGKYTELQINNWDEFYRKLGEAFFYEN